MAYIGSRTSSRITTVYECEFSDYEAALDWLIKSRQGIIRSFEKEKIEYSVERLFPENNAKIADGWLIGNNDQWHRITIERVSGETDKTTAGDTGKDRKRKSDKRDSR